MSTIITRVRKQITKKYLTLGGRESQNWLLEKVRQLGTRGSDRLELLREGKQKNKTIIGRMYFYNYDAKHKATLPYWDRFPLVIPIEQYTDGFLGLNLHYIRNKDRFILLNQLRRFATGSLDNERTRLRLSYPLLKATHEAYRATPCVKRYLAQHIRSKVIEIQPNEWHIAAVLPLQHFTSKDGLSQSQIWDESEEKF